jgi:hypothetical protein
MERKDWIAAGAASLLILPAKALDDSINDRDSGFVDYLVTYLVFTGAVLAPYMVYRVIAGR